KRVTHVRIAVTHDGLYDLTLFTAGKGPRSYDGVMARCCRTSSVRIPGSSGMSGRLPESIRFAASSICAPPESRRCCCPPFGGLRAPAITTLFRTIQPRPRDLPAAPWQAERAGDRLGARVRHETARVHHAAWRHGGGVGRAGERSERPARRL